MVEIGLWRGYGQVERLVITDWQASAFTTNQSFIQLTNLIFWKNSYKKAATTSFLTSRRPIAPPLHVNMIQCLFF